MVILAAVLLVAAVVAWPPRDRPLRVSGGVLATSLEGIGPGGDHDETAPARFWQWLPGPRRSCHSDDDEELLVLLDAIAPALAAGLPPAAALSHLTRRGGGDVSTNGPRVGPVEKLVSDLAAQANAGRPLAPVWARHAGRGPRGRSGRSGSSGRSGRSGGSGELAFVARAWSLSESLGAPLAECATVAARAVRQQSARRQSLAIALAGPRATATVLTALPLAGPVVGALLGLSPRQLYGTPVAAVSTLSGLALLLLGRWWCARLVAGIGRSRPTRRPGARGSPVWPHPGRRKP